MVWCPYTDRDLPEAETTREHIIPLSLGGMNGFELPVCRLFNSRAGSSIDGVVANDFLILTQRNKLDVRGHSGKRPVYVAKRSRDADTGHPVQLILDQTEGLKVWCSRSREYVSGGSKLEFSFNMDLDLDLRFVAKVALAAGYFVYGDLFRKNVRHDELRTIMNTRASDLGDGIYSIETLADGRFSEGGGERVEIIRALCRAVPKHSVVGLVPGPANLGIFVGVLGHYMGLLNVPAVTTSFPNAQAYHWGHVISPQDGTLMRLSFRRALEQLAATS